MQIGRDRKFSLNHNKRMDNKDSKEQLFDHSVDKVVDEKVQDLLTNKKWKTIVETIVETTVDCKTVDCKDIKEEKILELEISNQTVSEQNESSKIINNKMDKFTLWKLQLPPTCIEVKMLLASKNGHDRDQYIFFDEIPHKYYIWDKENEASVGNLISVTGFVGSYHHHFDADNVIPIMMQKSNFKTKHPELLNMSVDQIKAFWAKNGKDAADLGTIMHRQIELFYNCASEDDVKQPTPEYEFFLDWHQSIPVKKRWTPFRTEWRIWCQELQLTGTIDMIFVPDLSKPNEIIIYDWKRSKDISKDGFGRKMKKPFHKFPDSNFYHYSLQLNMYKYLIEKHYGFKVVGMFLGVFFPKNGKYQIEEIEDNLQSEIAVAVAQRLKEIGAMNALKTVNEKDINEKEINDKKIKNNDKEINK